MRTLPGSGGSATCTDLAGRSLLLPYALRGATEPQELKFERHLLECDLCYEDFLAVWRTSEIVSDWTPNPSETSATAAPQAGAIGRLAHSRRAPLFWATLAFAAGFALGRLI